MMRPTTATALAERFGADSVFHLAHMSDIHLGPLPPVRRRELASKRITGYLNWQRNRSGSMGEEALEQLVQHMLAARPDHIAVTGDLTNLALKEELRLARLWLERLGQPHGVSVVPGNHDTYVRGALQRIKDVWEPYMSGAKASSGEFFPYLRRRGRVALIGVNSGRASMPFYATGSFRKQQALDTGELLRRAATENLFRVVMIHHPPFPKATANHKRLVGAGRFRSVIAREGAELVLHGHTHIVSHETIKGPDGAVPVIGVPSASAAPRVGDASNHEHKRPAARYNLFSIGQSGMEWTCRMRQFGFADGHETVSLLDERSL